MPEYQIHGITVEFPHEAYDCQLEYMAKVIQALREKKNALLESPTGTGKTLCLLCASLAWTASVKADFEARKAGQGEVKVEGGSEVEGHERKTWVESMKEMAGELARPRHLPTIVYSSRTHSQLAQVMGELRNTSYKPRVAILGSRQQLCLHPNISTLSGGAQNQACRAACKSRECSWFNGLEKFHHRNPDVNLEPLEIEDLVKVGQKRNVCPFHLSRKMSETAEIVFMPYNYLIDGKVRGGLTQLDLDDSILIFDEAHNVESVCSSSSSFEIPAGLLGGCIDEANQAEVIAVKRQESQVSGHPSVAGDRNFFQLAVDMKVLREMLKALEAAIAALDCKGPNGFTRPGTYMMELLGKMKVCNEEDLWTLIRKLDEAADLISDDSSLEGTRRRSGGQKLQTIGDMLRTVAESLDNSGEDGVAPISMYRLHVRLEKGPRKNGFQEQYPTLNFWCFMPGLAMQALSRMNIRSFLLTSGTMSPLNSFAAELKLQFPIQLENPHVIDPSQVWIGVLSKGPKGVSMNSSYVNRERAEYKEDLGLALANIARIVPGGLLVFFPSYVVLQSCIDSWKDPTAETRTTTNTWNKICKQKQAVIEPRESALFNQAAADFEEKLNDPNYTGAIFFAVCRGKVSEGLDFSDRAGRAVVITGIPFANARDAQVRLKQDVLNEVHRKSGGAKRPQKGPALRTITGEQWYSQTAMRAVNQAMGRVIRHRKDYGAIILCDDRFASPQNQNQLSAWLRTQVKGYDNFGQANASLTTFFRDQIARVSHDKEAALSLGRHQGVDKTATFSTTGGQQNSSTRQSILSIAQVPAAMDASGLAKMTHLKQIDSIPEARHNKGKKLSLLSATATNAPASAAARGPAPGAPAEPKQTEPPGTLTDSLWASLESSSFKPRTARPGKENIHMQSGLSQARLGRSLQPIGNPSQSLAPKVTLTLKPDSSKATAKKATATEGQSQQICNRALKGPNVAENTKVGNFSGGDAKHFFSKLQQKLPADAFKQVRDALKAFREKSSESCELYATVTRVLCQPGRQDLLKGFSAFISKSERENFAAAVKAHLSSRKGSQPVPKSQAVGATLSSPEKKTQKGSLSAACGKTTKKSQPCSLCGAAEMRMPFYAEKCKHRACYNCWMRALSQKTECPVCHQHVTNQQISRVQDA